MIARPYGMADRFSAIYISGSEAGPVQIGYRQRPARVKDLLYYAWIADQGLARRVQLTACQLLDNAAKRIGGSKTFAIPLEWAKKVIAFAAQQHRIQLYTDADLRNLLQAERDRELKELAGDFGPKNTLAQSPVAQWGA